MCGNFFNISGREVCRREGVNCGNTSMERNVVTNVSGFTISAEGSSGWGLLPVCDGTFLIYTRVDPLVFGVCHPSGGIKKKEGRMTIKRDKRGGQRASPAVPERESKTQTFNILQHFL